MSVKVFSLRMYDPVAERESYERQKEVGRINKYDAAKFWANHLVQIIVNQFKRVVQAFYTEAAIKRNLSKLSIQNVRYLRSFPSTRCHDGDDKNLIATITNLLQACRPELDNDSDPARNCDHSTVMKMLRRMSSADLDSFGRTFPIEYHLEMLRRYRLQPTESLKNALTVTFINSQPALCGALLKQLKPTEIQTIVSSFPFPRQVDDLLIRSPRFEDSDGLIFLQKELIRKITMDEPQSERQNRVHSIIKKLVGWPLPHDQMKQLFALADPKVLFEISTLDLAGSTYLAHVHAYFEERHKEFDQMLVDKGRMQDEKSIKETLSFLASHVSKILTDDPCDKPAMKWRRYVLNNAKVLFLTSAGHRKHMANPLLEVVLERITDEEFSKHQAELDPNTQLPRLSKEPLIRYLNFQTTEYLGQCVETLMYCPESIPEPAEGRDFRDDDPFANHNTDLPSAIVVELSLGIILERNQINTTVKRLGTKFKERSINGRRGKFTYDPAEFYRKEFAYCQQLFNHIRNLQSLTSSIRY